MFVFTVGVPEAGGKGNNEEDSADKSGNGEVQYCPALLHMNLCSILYFSEHVNSMKIILSVLVDFASEKSKETYAQNLVDSKRRALREWVQRENRTRI
mmetsp:Transcript_8175/g.19335  ORF Transcript_8175/g.19335 Transcript_8175/m.19335 type:complete len:98 (+) Transcript_8175:571-864(+)